MAAAGSASQLTETVWPEEGLTRVPYRLFQDPQVYAAEQRALFQGPLWHFLCLAVEVANPGDFCTSAVGDTPVIVTRDADGEIYAFENRCAHRGALITLEQRGNVKDFSCVYHAWTYDRQGNLIGVAFKDGIKGKGGMPPSFCMQDHGPRKLRVAELHGLVFGSFSRRAAAGGNTWAGRSCRASERVLAGHRPRAFGRYTQALPNNWKLYMENVKEFLSRQHPASVLHDLRAEPPLPAPVSSSTRPAATM
jgi:anthranilate 1,2-dioxygenase large subunit